MAAAIAYAFWAGRERPRAYFGLMLFLTGAIVGVFTAQDLLLFYAFFEAMLIPLYVLIGVWGGPGRLGATIKFVIYTMAGSLLMLASIVVSGCSQGTFDLVDGGTSDSDWLFLGFVVAFAVKAPLFPFHGWLPDAYRESPPEVARVLSGVVSKAAVYGFLRIAIAQVPGAGRTTSSALILVLAAIGLVYGSLLAFRAPDLRGVIAYSSLAQMGLITLGLFAFNDLGLDGAVLQMVNHGLVSATLFLLAGGSSGGRRPASFALLGGMAQGRPALATVLMTTGIIALAVPGSATFAGEFLILAGVFDAGLGLGGRRRGRDRARRDVHAAADLGRAARGAGPAVTDDALDLRPAELGILVPLVALPARALGLAGGDHRPLVRRTPTPFAPWMRRSGDRRRASTGSRSRPTLALLGAGAALALLAAVLVPRAARASPRSSARSAFAGAVRVRGARSTRRRRGRDARSSPTRSAATAGPRSRR